ncbi:MAG: nicotinate-nucleotide adenylyltransferase, partial [Lactococcus chungangensis]|nr:nicotinate-nucleotide adenylyltransferase [Lactococcus chungangensis]NCB82617.1 nicotinate-nucleotide adenylyltransferase [Bacilli bacterium]
RDQTVLTEPKYPVQMIDLPLLNISSSYIRGSIKANHQPNFLLPAEVLNYINQHGLYQ